MHVASYIIIAIAMNAPGVANMHVNYNAICMNAGVDSYKLTCHSMQQLSLLAR